VARLSLMMIECFHTSARRLVCFDMIESLGSAQAAVEVQDAVIGESICGEENGGVPYFCWICHSVEGCVLEIRLLQIWLQFYTRMYISICSSRSFSFL
jgi:hypothetical protein